MPPSRRFTLLAAAPAIAEATRWPLVRLKNEKDPGTLALDRYAEIVAVRGDGWRHIGLRRVDLVIENDVRIR